MFTSDWKCSPVTVTYLAIKSDKMDIFHINISIFHINISKNGSVHLSACDTFFNNVPVIVTSWNFRNNYHWQKWCPCKRSRLEVKFQGHGGQKIANFDQNWEFSDCNSSLHPLMTTKWCTKLEVAYRRCPIFFKIICHFFYVTQAKISQILTRFERFQTLNPVLD